MEFSRFPALILLFLQFLDVSGIRHLVYWDKKLIPALSKEGLSVTLEINDWMDVLCPYYPNTDTPNQHVTKNEYVMIYNVTKDDFRNCDTRRGKILQTCDDPFSEKKLTTKFQETSPSPFGFTFRPGSTYYYVSKPRHQARNRECAADTMRMMVNVKQKGTVFSPNDRETTKTYHEQEGDKRSTRPQAKTMTTKSSGHADNIKHHHHHEHTTRSITSTVQPVFKIVDSGKARPSLDSEQTRQRRVQSDKPGNAGHGTMNRSSLPALAVLLSASSMVLALVCT